MARRFYPAESVGNGVITVDIDPTRAGWRYSGLRVLSLTALTKNSFGCGCASRVLNMETSLLGLRFQIIKIKDLL